MLSHEMPLVASPAMALPNPCGLTAADYVLSHMWVFFYRDRVAQL